MEPALAWAYSYLESDADIIVPIKRMWLEWRADNDGPDLESFTAALLADERFEEMPGVDHDRGIEWMAPEDLDEHEREMESLGYFSGPRLKLRSREITLEHIAKMLKKHNDRMEASLREAHDLMPEDVDEQEEGQLIDAIALAEELRRKLREAGLEPPEADDKESDRLAG